MRARTGQGVLSTQPVLYQTDMFPVTSYILQLLLWDVTPYGLVNSISVPEKGAVPPKETYLNIGKSKVFPCQSHEGV